MKILHVSHDDAKFIKVAADIFNSAAGVSNEFVVFATDTAAARKLFANLPHIRVVDRHYTHSQSLKADLRWCDCLVVHFLDGLNAKVVLQAPKDLPIVWSGWGGDYYYLIAKGDNNLLGRNTEKLVKLLDARNGSRRQRVLRWLRNVGGRAVWTPIIKKAMMRTNYFSSPFPEDFELLKSHLGTGWRAKYVRIFYGSVKLTYMPGPAHIQGGNILVGNSGTPTNNHLEIFDILARIDLGDRQIVAPLSYGDPVYTQAIISRGRKVFGSRFQPIVDFMSLEQYNTLIAGCSVVVMGTRRQQGGGNTVTMLYKGARVFLDEANTVYQYLKSRGAFVYSLRELQSDGANIFEPLTEAQKRTNRQVLEGYSGHEMVLRSVGELVELIRSDRVTKRVGVPSV